MRSMPISRSLADLPSTFVCVLLPPKSTKGYAITKLGFLRGYSQITVAISTRLLILVGANPGCMVIVDLGLHIAPGLRKARVKFSAIVATPG
jgi:hypothetical protein